MPQHPQPLFETFARFHELNFLHLNGELPVVRDFLLDFDDGILVCKRPVNTPSELQH